MTTSSWNSARKVLGAKLAPPPVNPAQVLRQALINRVCTSHTTKLVLIRAPAGFGKTTLMEQCRHSFAAMGVATSWLNLDGSDNDPPRFLNCLRAAIGQLTGDEPLPDATDGASERAVGETALSVLDSLTSGGHPYALFLDEFELIQDPTVLGLVRQLIDQLPPQGRLVIGSRMNPDLPLSRLRARGQLFEIDAQHLRFSLEETAAFFTGNRQLALSAEDLALLHRRTEGWVAALWLASLALERQQDRHGFIVRFSGSHDTIDAYLTDSVLAHQAPQIRHFLLRTSILKQLSVPLCQALVPEADAESLLAELQSADILLTPVEGEERWYRYHSLFSGFLQAHLKREAPEELPHLHRVASAWYAEQQRPVPAIDHAMAGEDFARASELLEGHAPRLLAEGRMRLLARWFVDMPPELLRLQPRLQAIQLWAVAYTRGAQEATALMSSTGLEHTRDPALQSYVLPLRILLPAMMDRVEDALAVGRQCITELPTGSAFTDAVLLSTVASIYANTGDFDNARALLEVARRTHWDKLTGFTEMYSESVEGVIDMQQGRLRQARARMKMALAASLRAGRSESNGNAWAGVLYACTLYEGNELDTVEQLLRAYVPLVCDLGLADLVIVVHVMQARIAFQRGDVDRAFQTLTDLEYLGRRRKLTRIVACAKLERSRVLLLQGHAQAAREELDRAEDAALWERVAGKRMFANELEDMAIGRLRWEVAAGDAAKCLPQLEHAIGEATATSHHLRGLKLRLLQAMALVRSGQQRASHAVLGTLLRQTCNEGFVRLIVDEGPDAGLLLSNFMSAMRKDDIRRTSPIFSEYLQRLLQAFGSLSHLETAAAEDTLPPQGQLSRKEISVLQLVADGYSDTAMAEKLFVSASTVRTHLRSIYAKLAVHSRMQAVLEARRIGAI
ncbi:LuxR C-terminal-related transcriptional regulator [Janthinobacterium sp. PC23-8]|uniref:LuxR C-terminal-related transcriptional regulator n=1 Tax=Janthinobacterium sp. PC23-8 TaxID=2012679 RepID=UPI000B96DCE3|nr:LuxR C-terminal-related transcriptional regulator [Janthinobacterium sp. PC23-8]OYO26308.1 hypothetical protein CD932_23985 [Janthinobacterium sp. PC23-8]